MKQQETWREKAINFFYLSTELQDPVLRYDKSLFVFQLIYSLYIEIALFGIASLTGNWYAAAFHVGFFLLFLGSLFFFKTAFHKLLWSLFLLGIGTAASWGSLLLSQGIGTISWNLTISVAAAILLGWKPGTAVLLAVGGMTFLQESFFHEKLTGFFSDLAHESLFVSISIFVGAASFFFFALLFLNLVKGTLHQYQENRGEMQQLLTDARKNEERSTNQINFLQTLMDLIPFPLFYKDLNGEFLSCNSSFCVVFDISKDDVFGHKNSEVFRPENAHVMTKIELEVLSREIMAAEEASLIHADGKKHDFIVYFMPFVGVDRDIHGFIGVLIDITERKEKEETLVRLNSTKDQLFSIISHDLRGPVGKVKQLLDVYIDDPDIFDKGTWEQVFHDMRKSADSLFQLLENLLSWARSQKGDYVPRPEVFPFEPLVNEVFSLQRLLAGDKKIELKTVYALQGPLLSDKAILSTIVRNLVHNALKFTPEGGSVTVHAQETDEGVSIEVIDTGVGMTQETIDKIFGRKERVTTHGTAKEKGQGLGIGLCLDLAHSIGATLEAKSTLGTGTTFKLFLPTAEL